MPSKRFSREQEFIIDLKHKSHDIEKASTAQRAPQPQQEMALAANEHTRPMNPAVVLQRVATSPPSALRPADLRVLQRTIGNRAIQRMLGARLSQPDALSVQSSIPMNAIQRKTEEEETLQGKFEPLQKQSVPEEETITQLQESEEEAEVLQGKFDVAQRQSPLEEQEETLQGKFATPGVIQRFPVTVEARGAAHKIRGGTSVRARVGAESEWVYGSRPKGKTPNLLTKVGAVIQGTQRYIAGHLLNDNMGGQGVNNNLTVLSSDGNKSHRGIEGKVKNLAQKADLINHGNNILGNPAYDHGARYTVTVLAPQPTAKTPFSPQEKHIGAGLRISIDPIRIHKVSGVESVWPQESGGNNDLTNHDVDNVPPYPDVPKPKKLTPTQKHIVKAILVLKDKNGSPLKSIWGYIQANINPAPTRKGVAIALSKGVASKFFYKRKGLYKVIAQNIT